MLAAIASAWALLLGIALLMIGNGLQGTLLGVRATMEEFGTGVTGLVMTGYFAGFMAGSWIVPRLLAGVGHVRVFAALASLASGAALLHALFVSPVSWGLIRLVTGFCFAGLFVVAESWINDAATNRTRGQLLSVYMIIVTGGMGAGQFLLNLADPREFELFVLVSILISFALVPITLSAGRAPVFEAPESIGVRALFRASPLGVVGAFTVGIAHGALFSMGAVYATRSGMAVDRISFFIAAALLGGLVLQWPVGWLSDRFDRRKVIVAAAWVATSAALGAGMAGAESYAALIALTALLGGMSLPLYSLCGAHTNDHLTPRQMVAASATLVLVSGAGLTLGPSLAASMMRLTGPPGMFWSLAIVHGCVGAFGLYRMMRRDPVPLDEQRSYRPVNFRTSQVGQALASHEARDSRAGGQSILDDDPALR